MSIEFLDCQCFAGGFTLGAVRAGLKLVGKREHPGGFGVPACEGNRHLLGGGWEAEAVFPAKWTPRAAPVLLGNPPCSAFSSVTPLSSRGMDAKVNTCMWDFWGFAARCKPVIAAMESVQQAYTQGLPLMRRLRAQLEADSGLKYDLTHVLHSCGQCGGRQRRHRYFMVCHRAPFGIEAPQEPPRIPTLGEAIGDLRSADIEGNEPIELPEKRARQLETLLGVGYAWAQDQSEEQVLQRAFDGDCANELLEAGYSLEHIFKAAVFGGVSGGASRFCTFRPNWDFISPTVTGGTPWNMLHPLVPRLVTHREVARLMGFPDTWKCAPAQANVHNAAWWGKGVTVNAGEWLASWIKHSLKGKPGSLVGEPLTDGVERERTVNVTRCYELPPKPEQAREVTGDY